MSTKFKTLAALVAVLSFSAIADANAWTRSGSVTGWRGTASVHASGSCANGTCSRSATVTGPYGNTASRSGSASCGGGSCSGSSTATGPRGNSVHRQVTVSR